MVSQAQVMIVLKPWLGGPLLEALTPTVGEIAGRLNGFSFGGSRDGLAAELDSLLFRVVRQATGGRMLIALEDGTWVRVRLEDFAAMADELMLLPFLELPTDEKQLQSLRDYSMRYPSLSALRALYTRFAPLQTREELAAITSVVKSCYPPFRWREWLQ